MSQIIISMIKPFLTTSRILKHTHVAAVLKRQRNIAQRDGRLYKVGSRRPEWYEL